MTDDIYEIPSKTPDLQTELAQKLQELVPEVIADGKVDVAKLTELLAGDAADSNERFGLFWPGKKRALRAAQEPTTATLRPDKANSKDWDTTKNVFIEGDNLEVLKILQKHYHGKIKMIYIDPPYNTGKDFVYPDNYKEGLDTYLEWTKQVNEEGKKVSTNSESEGRYHSNWLNMVYPRLKLARNLLTDDGVILVSINDVEQPHLRRVLDEVFGEANFVAQFIWVNEGNIDQQSKIKGTHEYVLTYSRNASALSRPTVIDPNIDESSKLFNDTIENSITKNGPANPPSVVELPAWFPVAFDSGTIPPREDSFPHILDSIEVVGGRLARPARVRSGWSSRNLLDLFIKNGGAPIQDAEGKETRFELRDTGAIYMLKRRADDQGHVLSVLRNMGTTKQNSSMLSGWGLKFSYPKPQYLIEYLITAFTRPKDDAIILDFFCGSATTGHAVMAANSRDGGVRQCIQVQLPEPATDKDGAPTTIAELARRRIDKAGDELRSRAAGANVDVGFRSFCLSNTNFAKWRVTSDIESGKLEQHLLSLRDSAEDDATSDALLTELLLKQGHSLTERSTDKVVAGLSLQEVGDGLLLAYLDEHTKPKLDQLREVVDQGPARFVILEDAFQGDDELKTNLTQLCKSKGVELWTA
ncbi:site-specific DNA-methyltransferase [Dietzia maris]|uniref:site-specific DNA-methyltransferase n=1 Tax=Dietzia maris TaxID=37915 RepID=UPI00223BC2BF|nr:site-specific DNA-methyltransferase [Dietzia maris]MCT1434926.1 site-specific DNA-methyltransferase [Dietzia maris]MCT1522161.1 site-specific DNA-methyltransferase [Dietzia maris]